MCRVIAYLGAPVLLDNLLFLPDNSLVRQTYAPQMLDGLNLAGFGMAAWDPATNEPDDPFLYKVTDLPLYDRNLGQLARKLRPTCVLAHVRGVPFDLSQFISTANIHPFQYQGFRLCMAHNGELARFDEMKLHLARHIAPRIARQIAGTTDSEWIYALLMSRVPDPTAELTLEEIVPAVGEALDILRGIRRKLGIEVSSSVNLFLCDGKDLVATRFTFDFGCYGETVAGPDLSYPTLWFTLGRDYGLHDEEWKMVGGSAACESVLVASEPLTLDTSTWIEVPEYSALYVTSKNGRHVARTVPLDA